MKDFSPPGGESDHDMIRTDTQSISEVEEEAPAARVGRMRWVLLAVAVGGVVCALVWARARATGRTPSYETARISRGTIQSRVTANGTVSPRVTVQVGSQISGRIQELFVDFNSKVQRGQILAKLDPELSRAAVDSARAALAASRGILARATAQSNNLNKTRARVRALVERNLVAHADLDKADADVAMSAAEVVAAKGGVAQARAALNQANTNLTYTTIRSPVDGVVISRNVDVGQTVAASLQAPTLFTIAQDLTKMQVHTNVPEADIGRLASGMASTFTVDAYPEQRFAGVVQTVRNASQIAQNVVTYDAVVDVDNTSLKLRPGMTATVTFIVAEKSNVLGVPLAALRFRPTNKNAESQGSEGTSDDADDGDAETPKKKSVVGRDNKNGRSNKNGSKASKPIPDDHRIIYLLTGRKTRAVEVEVGLSDGSNVEISGPVSDADVVIVAERDSGASHEKRAPRLPKSP